MRKVIYDRTLLLMYIFLLIFISSYHNLYFLSFVSIFIALLSGKYFFNILKKTVLSIFIFNSSISISYGFYTYIKGNFDLDYLLLINLRVFTITFLTFYVFNKINIVKSLSFSKSLSFILMVSLSQIYLFKRLLNDFNDAINSRSLNGYSLKSRIMFFTVIFKYFLNKAFENSKDISYGIKSRGFYID